MLDIINSKSNSFIMAVSPIYSKEFINNILETDTFSIEIIDTAEAIYDRLIIDGDDALEYKEKYKSHYIREIKYDQTSSDDLFKDIAKVHINNQNIEAATDTVYKYLENNKILN